FERKPHRRQILHVGEWARSPEDRDRGRRALQSIARMRVAAGRIADDLDRELRCDGCTVCSAGWPGTEDPEQSALQQERMRRRVLLRQVRTVGTIDRGE